MMDVEPKTPTKQGGEKEKEKQKEKRDKGDEILSADLKKKEQQDFSGLVEAKLPEYTALALEGGKLPEALELLMALEKQTRQGGDDASTAKVACCIVRVCYEAKDWLALNESLVTLSKRRGQSKKAVQQMVQEAMTFVEAITDMPIKLDLIKTLRNITEGKIFVEIERAKLTRTLAYIKEAAGEISDAADLLQEVQVETYGSMEPRDKIDYILEQVRLCLAKQDFVRAHIISNKIAASAINKEEFQDLKLRYHELMIQYYSHKKDYLNICRAYRAMYDTKCIKEGDKEKWKQLLRLIVVYAVLAPYANDQFDIMHRINADKNLLELPKYRLVPSLSFL
ncbi:26S proteasome non-ATPase regulatory subunit 12 [Balamuthia mandrillaris]